MIRANLKKRKPKVGQHNVRKSVFAAAIMLSTVTCYSLLVAGDWALTGAIKRADARIAEESAPYQEIKRKRDEANISLMVEALNKDLMPMLTPWSIELDKRYSELVNQLSGAAPLAPQPNTPVFYCNEGYGMIAYRTDRFGLRNKDALWDQPAIDVAMIGDSYIHGACVLEKDSINSKFMEFTGKSSLNLATGGNGPLVYSALIKEFVPIIQPKYVVLSFSPNDNLDERSSVYWDVYAEKESSPVEYFAPAKPGQRPHKVSNILEIYYKQAQTLMFSPPGSEGRDSVEETIAPKPSHLTLSVIRSSTQTRWRDHFADPPESTILAIQTLVQTCESLGCTPIFMYLPSNKYMSPDPRAKSYKSSIKRYLKRHASSTLLDMSEPISQLGMHGFAPEGRHYSPEGYGVVAKLLAQHIEAH